MSFEILPGVTPWLVAFALVAFVGTVLAVGVVGEAVVRHRQTRLAGHQTFGSYYRHLALGH
jgi:hypothetical protein